MLLAHFCSRCASHQVCTRMCLRCPLPTYESLQPTSCISMTLSSVSPEVWMETGTTVTVTGVFCRTASLQTILFLYSRITGRAFAILGSNFLETARDLLHCVLQTQRAPRDPISRLSVPAVWVNESTLTCDIKQHIAGMSQLYIGKNLPVCARHVNSV